MLGVLETERAKSGANRLQNESGGAQGLQNGRVSRTARPPEREGLQNGVERWRVGNAGAMVGGEWQNSRVTLDAGRLAGLLAEPDRRRVVAALILEAGTLDDIVSATGLDARSVVDALDRLTSAGLVESGADGTYVVLEESFKAAARAAAPSRPTGQHGDEPDDHQRVLDRAIVDGRIVKLPTKRSKRLIVLERLAQEFEPGVRYVERDVNGALRRFDDDVAALRRYLVDEGFLDRADGEYWRSGGRVEV